MKRPKIKNLILGLILFASVAVNLLLSGRVFCRENMVISNIQGSSYYNKVVEILKTAAKSIADIPYLVYYLVPAGDIPSYSLIIDRKDIYKLNENIPSEGFQFTGKREKVPAEFIFNGKKYAVEVSYRGDWANHWAFKKKSLQIDFSDEYFDNCGSIGLIVPKDRGFFAEELNNYRAKKMELDAPESKFVILNINGEKAGVYFQIEPWGKDFLEKSELGSDTNFYGEDTDGPIFNSIFYWRQYAADPHLAYADYAQMDKLISLVKDASDSQFYEEIVDLVDMDNFYAWNIHSMLSGSAHQDGTHNIRLYFDNTIGKFKFIVWDVGLEKISTIRTYEKNKAGIDFINYNPIAARILKNDDFLKKRNELLWAYVSDDRNLEDDLAYYDGLVKTYKYVFYQDSNERITKIDFDKSIKNSRKLLRYNFKYIKDLFNKAEFKERVGISEDNAIEIILDIKSYSLLMLKDIEFFGKDNKSDFLVYYDSNEDGKFSYADKKIGSLNYIQEKSEYEFRQENTAVLFNTKRIWLKNKNPEFIVLKEIEGEELQETAYRIFITPKKFFSIPPLDSLSIKTVLSNYYTKSDITGIK